MTVRILGKRGALSGRSTAIILSKKKKRLKSTINSYSKKPYRLGRRPGKQGLRALLTNQGRDEKLATRATTVSDISRN